MYQAQLEKADYAIFLTNDVELRMHTLNLWIGMLIKSCQTVEQPILRKKNGRIAAGIQYFPKEFHWPISPWRNQKSKLFSEDYYKTGFICGACFSVNMKLFRSIWTNSNSRSMLFIKDLTTSQNYSYDQKVARQQQ